MSMYLEDDANSIYDMEGNIIAENTTLYQLALDELNDILFRYIESWC